MNKKESKSSMNTMNGLTASVLLLSLSMTSAQLMNRCGDCWSIFTGELDSCPTDTEGIADTFDDSFDVYGTFQLTSSPDFLKLQDPNGDPCYPFKETLGPLDRYPESNLPQCVVPPAEGVCAYKYEEQQSCSGRNYEIITYDSREASIADGAAVTHNGACGVCSSAQDFSIWLQRATSIDEDSVLCVTRYTLNPNLDTRFNTMIGCFAALGFSPECSLLWAHRGGANAAKCAAICLNDLTYNGEPPTCTLGPCLVCSVEFQQDYDRIGGRTYSGSGITEVIPRATSEFFRVTHDPCVGAVETIPPTQAPTITAMPTMVATDGGVSIQVARSTMMLGLVGIVRWLAM